MASPRSLLKRFFFPSDEEFSSGDEFSEEEINRIYRESLFSQLDYYLKNPAEINERYETLKENFPDIINRAGVDTRRFIQYVRLLYPQMNKHGDWQQGIDFLNLGISARRAEEDKLESYLWLSLFHGYIAEYEPAISFAQKSIKISRSLENNASLNAAMTYLARAYRGRGDYEKAIDCYRKIIAAAGDNDSEEEIAHAYASMGLTYWHLNEYEKSLGALRDAQDRLIELNNEERIGHTFNNIGLVYTDLGLYEKALANFEKAVAIAEKRDDKKEAAIAEGNMGMAYFFLGRHDTALQYLKKTMLTMERIKSNYRLAKAKSQIAQVYRSKAQDTEDTGTLEIAADYAKEAYEIGLRYQIVHFEIMGQSYRAMILKNLRRMEEAVSCSEKAVKLLSKVKVFDGREEEIYFNHYQVVKETNTADALIFLQKSFAEIQTKFKKIAEPEFQKSFVETELCRQILEEAREQIGTELQGQ